MFIGTAINLRLALQRSAMFPAMNMRVAHVSLLWSEEKSFGVVHSINISSLRDEESTEKSCSKNKNLHVCCTDVECKPTDHPQP